MTDEKRIKRAKLALEMSERNNYLQWLFGRELLEGIILPSLRAYISELERRNEKS